jgi:tetratricopeptide (TPR) repeat protein
VAYVIPQVEAMPVDQVLNRIKSDNPADKRVAQYGVELDNIPTDKILVPVDTEAVLKSGLVAPEQSEWLAPYIVVDLGDRKNAQGQPTTAPKQYIAKHEMMILDMLKNNADWSRPIYFASTVGQEQYLRLEPYFRQDGVAYRVMPYEAMRYERINTDTLYNNIMNKYQYGNMEQKGLYLDENCIRMARNFRLMFCQLASKLVQEGDTSRTEKVCDYALKAIPSYNVPYDFYSVGEIANAYYQIGKKEKADAIYTELMETYLKNLNWYNRLSKTESLSVMDKIRMDTYYGQYCLSYFGATDPTKYNKYLQEYSKYAERFQRTMEQNGMQ